MYVKIEYGMIRTPNNNFLMTIFIEEVHKNQYVVGMTLVDISTGELFIHEIYSEPTYDEKYPLDEVVHLYKNYQPKEVLYKMAMAFFWSTI